MKEEYYKMRRKQSYYVIIIIVFILILIITYTRRLKYSEDEKYDENRKYSENEVEVYSENDFESYSENTWNGNIWYVSVKSFDTEKNLCTLNFRYNGELSDLQKIKKISFALGSENKTQIINVFDISQPNQEESYEGEYEDMGILMLDFKKLQTINFEVEFDDPLGNGEVKDLFQNKLLIVINWSYSFDAGLDKKDTIKIN
jgi:SepF-like predicted cell division protein (DUF552 family)